MPKLYKFQKYVVHPKTRKWGWSYTLPFFEEASIRLTPTVALLFTAANFDFNLLNLVTLECASFDMPDFPDV